MKNLTVYAVVALMLLASVCFAGNDLSAQKLDWVKTSYLSSLNSDNQGVRNSAIFAIVLLKKSYPVENMNKVVKKLNNISKNDPITINRLHAQLAVICLQNPELIETIDDYTKDDSRTFFNQVYEVISNEQIALR